MRTARRQKQQAKHQQTPTEEVFPGIDQEAAEREYWEEAPDCPETYYRGLDREGYKYLTWWEKVNEPRR